MKVKSFDRRTELLEAALNEFINKSYEEASLNSIIKNAGISKGTFYYHFQDKQALYLSLLSSCVDAKLEFLNSVMKDYIQGETDTNIFENFKLQARIGVEFAKAHPRFYLFGMMFVREKGNKIYDVGYSMLGDNTEKVLEELLDKAIDRGEIRRGIPKEFVLRILTYLLMRFDEIFQVKENALDFGLMIQNLDDFIDFMQYGLGGHGQNGSDERGVNQ